jgi:hypothetical protein
LDGRYLPGDARVDAIADGHDLDTAYYFFFAKAPASSLALSMKSCVTGLSARSFNRTSNAGTSGWWGERPRSGYEVDACSPACCAQRLVTARGMRWPREATSPVRLRFMDKDRRISVQTGRATSQNGTQPLASKKYDFDGPRIADIVAIWIIIRSAPMSSSPLLGAPLSRHGSATDDRSRRKCAAIVCNIGCTRIPDAIL